MKSSIGSPVHNWIAVHDAIHAVPEATWQADGEPRDRAGVEELTGLVDLSRWPVGMRLVVRREKPHPGAGPTLFEQADGWRYQCLP